jgi:transcriptional regulator with XRE-family HTH domain
VDPLDSAFLDDDGVRAALAARDIGTLYRLLGRAGVSQRQIAQLTGQSQSEVCEILKGRKVRDVWVLERIADGLGIFPRADGPELR